MQNAIFSPNNSSEDRVSETLAKIARTILIVVLGLTPILFVPAVYAPFNFFKVFFVIAGVFLALIFYSLAVLRTGTLNLSLTIGIYAAWVLALLVLLSAIFSGDLRDSLIGEQFGVQTAVFVGVIALVASAIMMLRSHKTSVMGLYVLLTGSGILVGLYQIIRLIFGPDTLTFGVFQSATATPLGGWNDLAIFFGLSLLLALVAIEQFPLTKWGRGLFGLVSVISLIILAVINFFAIWIVLGLVSLVVLMYTLTKNRLNVNSLSLPEEESSSTVASVVLSVAVFIVSVAFVVGGPALGQMISKVTDISYVEVRPSFEATVNITKSVYGENAFTGIGPNKFIDAWRLYKDPSINQTIFWNTPFEAGIGYIPTFASTTGIIGILAWLAFLVLIVRAGIKTLFTSVHVDRFWYFIGTSSFVAALYLWGMAVVYVPGPAILILAAVFTGVLFMAHSAIIPGRTIALSIINNRRAGFVLVAITMVVIVSSVTAIYFAGRHYSGLLSFNKALASIEPGASIDEIERQIAGSFQLSSSDRFAREIVGLQISKINTLLNLTEPTEAQRQQFQSSVANAINASQLAIEADPTEPQNWQALGNVYSILTSVGIEGAYDRAKEAFTNARQFDPVNPSIALQLAQLESRAGNLDQARTEALAAVRLKRNYTQAYFFLTQVDIARGDVASAIDSTLATITLEPSNPARYYQLGVLYSSQDDFVAAAEALETAVNLDNNYANARYFLALAYDALGRSEEAKSQLETILSLNPNNNSVMTLIDRLNNGEPLTTPAESGITIDEPEAEVGADGEVITTEDPDSPLLTPVNTIPEESSAEETEASENAESETAGSATEEASAE